MGLCNYKEVNLLSVTKNSIDHLASTQVLRYLNYKVSLKMQNNQGGNLHMYCCIETTTNLAAENNTHLLSHSSRGGQSRQTQLDFLLRISQGWRQMSTGDSEEEFASELIHVVDWIQFP